MTKDLLSKSLLSSEEKINTISTNWLLKSNVASTTRDTENTIWEHEKIIKEFSSDMLSTQGSPWEVTEDDHRAWPSCERQKNNCRTLAKRGHTGILGLLALKWYSVLAHGESESLSVESDSWWPHGLQSPWNSPSQTTEVCSSSLLQGIFPIRGVEWRSPALQVDSLPAEPPGKPWHIADAQYK